MWWVGGSCDLQRCKFLVLLILIGCSEAYLNIFISQSQVMKLLGLEAELYYVREGVVNAYAMNFVVPVPANIADLEFSWQSLAGHPLPYSMELDYDVVRVAGAASGMMALLSPRVNVSAKGEVPVVLQVFRIRLPCSGLVSAEIPLALRLNVTAPPGTKYNDTILVFKRNKICLKGVETPPRNESVRLEPGPLVNGAGALYVAATCACALILVVGSVASALYIRNSKARVQESHYSAADTDGLARSSVLVRVDPRPGSANSGSYATIADLEPLYARPCGSRASYYAASHVTHLSQSTDPCEKARALSVPRSALYCRNLVQEGTFGRVYRGTLDMGGREQEVIIKTVTEVASAYQASLLVVEGSQLAGLVHANIASLAAACLDSSCPLLAYTSTQGELNLKLYLTDGSHHPVTRDLVNVGAQVARAGAFLHGRGLLHRDIAARNCLIEPNSLRVRLADAALARDLFPQDYHCLGDNENRPIRWMALESLQHNQYSTATDVWSFGVFLWELATLGQQPYVEVDPFEMMVCLRDGYRLAQPRPCPDELFAVMAVCWLGLSRDRPTMPQLLAYLQDFHDALGGFI
ncbi:tyrosine-protein kinase Drl-like isoform X2 [Vespa velutina]|uniref:tyrosine-protein kinase Drl isoform X2 n=1 Tax=Vespa crabro TaxID=7445 RepID=UPI001EFFEF23|nr:tyrosine-protein kinase Drl isoform X2 [Vespa crabro]XP_047352895.1 tyrosine-protein kinase Drl-like isoform X2 [Vespa velutina]